jgi:hypothetical protein
MKSGKSGLHVRQACAQPFDPLTQHAQGFTQLGSLRLAPASTPYDPRSHHPSPSNPTTTAPTPNPSHRPHRARGARMKARSISRRVGKESCIRCSSRLDITAIFETRRMPPAAIPCERLLAAGYARRAPGEAGSYSSGRRPRRVQTQAPR